MNEIIMAMIDNNGMLTGIGRAPRAALISVKDGKTENIEELDIGWDESHEREQEGQHHAAVARFLTSRKVNEVVASGAGEGMRSMIEKMGIRLRFGDGDYRNFVNANTRKWR